MFRYEMEVSVQTDHLIDNSLKVKGKIKMIMPKIANVGLKVHFHPGFLAHIDGQDKIIKIKIMQRSKSFKEKVLFRNSEFVSYDIYRGP